MSANKQSIAARVEQLLERQIDLLKDSVSEFDARLADDPGPANERMADVESMRAHNIAQMDEELQILRREWEAADDVQDEERLRVRELARETRELVEALQSRIERLGEIFGEEMISVRESMHELNRGKQMTRGYKPGRPDDGRGLDREA